MTSHPRVLLWDIETSHNLVALFRLFGDDYIPAENIVQERYIICAAWKVLGKPAVHAVSVLDDAKHYKADPHNDRQVCQVLHDELTQADVLVAHNGDKYDIKFTAARMLFHGLSPLPPIPTIDTLKVAKDRFLFNSNRLDYLGHFLKVGRKKPTTTGLWLQVLQGNADAIREMVRYNKQDVELLERVFLKLQPYVKDHLNRQLLGDIGCPRCGSLKTQARGTHRALTRLYQRYQCQACGGWFRDVHANSTGTNHRVL